MTHQNTPEGFKGKTIGTYLHHPLKRGAIATSEPYGNGLSDHFSAGVDAAKETALVFLITWAASPLFPLNLLCCLGCSLLIWKAGRSALIGWNRLERLHKVIEEERFHIQHHREQGKEKLKEMYAAKGFSGEFLDNSVDVLMADDNRLLRVMLEEKLGLSLEVYEHPLKQAFGALLGVIISFLISIGAIYFWPHVGVPLFTILIIMVTSSIAARCEKRSQMDAAVWNGALGFFACGVAYLLSRLLG
jgi:hypothetical protein